VSDIGRKFNASNSDADKVTLLDYNEDANTEIIVKLQNRILREVLQFKVRSFKP